ncbi:hypothetical protein MBA34_13485 [Pseudomonas capeferrum]|uniref:hypothetical protein n=1 Tax=Pseudomonas capeferrum TaxID=1495066 RepID=UPI0004D54674|nr:hypothetical protein [Pseudomonas capeferrum]KEY87778.1 hypothetical protein PC358_01300 [Pseudomonas capeferrum]MCH7300051.1 hypothetical protein [Pseudomonas capeferrum]
MPTETRSSNTEMVSVPRETIEQAEKLLQEDNRCTMAREFRTILAKPADQHQGEPVAYADPRSFENLKSFGRLGGIYLHEWMWAEPEPGMVPLYTHAAQGEPVAYLCKSEGAKWLQYGSKVGDPWKPGEVEVTPLFAHADPGEVERLREEVEKQRRLKMHVAENLQNALDNCSVYRAQLAEQSALLQLGLEMINRGIVSFDDQIEYRQKLAALSASAEPSAPVERDEFEKEFPVPGGVRFLEADNCYVDERFDYEGGGSYQPAWEAWQARAALE